MALPLRSPAPVRGIRQRLTVLAVGMALDEATKSIKESAASASA